MYFISVFGQILLKITWALLKDRFKDQYNFVLKQAGGIY